MTRIPPAMHRAAGVLALCAMAVPLAACGGSAKPAGQATTATSPATAAPSASTGPSASAGPTAAAGTAGPSPAAGSPAACPTRSLQAKAGVSQGTAGSVYQVIDFTNIGNVPCSLYGYPGVALAGGTPVTQVGLAAARNSSTPRTLITLAPGAVANALLQITDAGNYPPSKCQLVTTTYLQIIPPDQTTPIYLGYKSQGCAKAVQLLSIGAIAAGAGSSS